MNAYKKIYRNFIDYGFSVTAKKSISHLLGALYSNKTYRLYRIDINNIDHEIEAHKHLTVSRVSYDDSATINEIEIMEEWLKGKLRHKIVSGSHCYVCRYDEQLAGFMLISFGLVYVPLIFLYRYFRKTHAWSEQITVKREYRSLGVSTYLRKFVFNILSDFGTTRLYAGTLLSNKKPIRISGAITYHLIADIHMERRLTYYTYQLKRL